MVVRHRRSIGEARNVKQGRMEGRQHPLLVHRRHCKPVEEGHKLRSHTWRLLVMTECVHLGTFNQTSYSSTWPVRASVNEIILDNNYRMTTSVTGSGRTHDSDCTMDPPPPPNPQHTQTISTSCITVSANRSSTAQHCTAARSQLRATAQDHTARCSSMLGSHNIQT